MPLSLLIAKGVGPLCKYEEIYTPPQPSLLLLLLNRLSGQGNITPETGDLEMDRTALPPVEGWTENILSQISVLLLTSQLAVPNFSVEERLQRSQEGTDGSV